MSYDKKDRPETVEDLTKRERTGDQVATLRMSTAAEVPRLAQTLAETLMIAEEDDRLEIENVGWHAEVRLALSTEQLQTRLEESQREWDNATKKIQQALDGEDLDSWSRHVAKTAAKARGIDLGWEED